MSFNSIDQAIALLTKELSPSTLVAVSKYHPVEKIEQAYAAGQRHFGESRVQDLQQKSEYFFERHQDIVWHFIGRLQSNKINHLLRIRNLKFIHSIDSLSLLEDLLKRADQALSPSIGLFLQVNTSGEAEKGGFSTEESLQMAIDKLLDFTEHHPAPFYWAGLMTMGPIRTDDFEGDTKRCFAQLAELRQRLQLEHPTIPVKLSMGMSSDFHWAQEFGSDFLRLGSIVFGED